MKKRGVVPNQRVNMARVLVIDGVVRNAPKNAALLIDGDTSERRLRHIEWAGVAASVEPIGGRQPIASGSIKIIIIGGGAGMRGWRQGGIG